MNIHPLSDLHLEFFTYCPSHYAALADVIVIAGDVGSNAQGLHWARKQWSDKRIVMIAGNHEFYRGDRLLVLANLRAVAQSLDIDFLENNSVVIGDTRFLGATLWTDFKLFGNQYKKMCMNEANNSLADFSVIIEGDKCFSPQDSLHLHEASLHWLETQINTHFDGHTVVVTHHLPSMQSVTARWKNSLLSACFASHLDYLLDGDKVKLWIHGHTHDSLDYKENGTRVICNPRGYKRKEGDNENLLFDKDLIIQLTPSGTKKLSNDYSDINHIKI